MNGAYTKTPVPSGRRGRGVRLAGLGLRGEVELGAFLGAALRPALGNSLAADVEARGVGAIGVQIAEQRVLQPPKLWKTTGTDSGTLIPPMPTSMASANAARPRRRG